MSAKPYPKKLFYRIAEVAEILGVETYVLRFWESKFPMLRPERDGKDDRRYRQRDIEMLLRIRTLLYHEKYTIAGAAEKLRRDPTGAIEGEFRDAAREDAEVRSTNGRPRRRRPSAAAEPIEKNQLDLFAPEAPPETVANLRTMLDSLRREIADLLTTMRPDEGKGA